MFFSSSTLLVKSIEEVELAFPLYYRLVVSSLEALENCFAVSSSSEKVNIKI